MDNCLNNCIDIRCEDHVISRVFFGEKLQDAEILLKDYRDVHIVCDENVAYAARMLGGNASSVTMIHAGEGEKTMETVIRICTRLLQEGADRSSLLLGIGGGITTDMAGFAACIYKRGIRFGFIPTTLLSQVDAGIGGKTGVNFLGYKNMLGVIRQSEFTFICPEPLSTLPRREFLCGAAEMLKTFIIDDRNGCYERAVRALQGIDLGDEEQIRSLGELIREAASVKAGIVSRDQFESGERRQLNLGHTFAHAIEKVSGGEIAHGEAVAMGIILAARLSDRALEEKLKADFEACGLPAECPFPVQELAGAMALDKKAEGDIIHFIVPVRIGQVREMDLSAEGAVALLTR